MMIEEEEEEYNLRWRKRKGRNGGDWWKQREQVDRKKTMNGTNLRWIISYMKNQASDR